MLRPLNRRRLSAAMPLSGLVIAPGVYVGPGEVAGWTANQYGYWGLRAWDASYATGSNPCIDIADDTHSNTATINIATDGYVDTAALAAFITAHGSIVRVTKVYQQIPGAIVGANHLIVGGGTGGEPLLAMSQIGGLPYLTFAGDFQWLVSASAVPARAQPITAAWIGQQNGGTYVSEGNFDCQFGVTVTGAGGISSQSDGSRADYTGNTYDVDHSYISIMNGASSSMKIDSGAVQTGNPGTAGFGGAVDGNITVGADTPTGGVPLSGKMFEVFMVAGAPDATAQAALAANMHAIGTGF